jgi:3-hydroxyacyl-CoA dehydrogenase
MDYLRRSYHRTRALALESLSGPDWEGFERVGIVGAGIMGASIAQVHLEKLLPVTLVDTNPLALERARESIADGMSPGVFSSISDRKHQISNLDLVLKELLTASPDIAALEVCDLVIETIAEKSAAKQSLLASIETCVQPRAIIASNTSTIPISRLARVLKQPKRFCGMHFCHPVQIRPLVEVIPGSATSDATSQRALKHVAILDRLPILVADGHGFIVNRLLLAYIGEGLAMLGEGVDPERIEDAASSFGMAMGPLEMLDGIGLDTALHSGVILSEVAAERMADTQLLIPLVKAGDLGQKTGAGIFAERGAILNPRLRELMMGRFKPESPRQYNSLQICNRLLLPMMLEALRILGEGKVVDPATIDLAAVFGLGFPATVGGPLAWAERLGAAAIGKLSAELPELGARGRPPISFFNE